MSRPRFFSLLFRLAIGVGSIGLAARATTFSSDFSEGFGPWQKSPSGTWTIQTENENSLVALTEAGTQPGGVRRPTGYLLLPQFRWSNDAITCGHERSNPHPYSLATS
jgi:hypothetical protein